ncbi:MAG: protein kinase, partial [Gemmatimonadota bacterium]|nr:protein kinase [Gemmatimonadota bacterium]
MSDLMDRLRPALPTRYRLVREIGRGGAARVFLARELRPQRQVAIKVLDPAVAATVGADRFLREVELASTLAHPHILPIFAAGEADGLLYYVMPYIEGDTLRDLLAREHQLPIARALQIGREVADALDYAHHQDVVHRDIKPENILLQADHAIVADFGIARAIAPTAGRAITEIGYAVGTPAYMSPEQAVGTETVDARSDIYSLGCVLYEMLAGEPPHLGATPEAIMAKKLYATPPQVSLLRESVPPPVDAAVRIALARAPADRFTSAERFREALSFVMPTPDGVTIPSPTVIPIQRARASLEGVSAARQAEPPQRRAWAPTTRLGVTLVLGGVMAANWIETVGDNRVGTSSGTIAHLRHQLAHALHWLEGGISFVAHDVTNDLAAYGYAAVYFFVFPVLVVAVAIALARRASIVPYRVFGTAVATDYALSLPFYLLLPIPERWSASESGAVLLSDRWTSTLIETVRPISGLDNCFPSFHVSLTVIVLAASVIFRVAGQGVV